MSYQNNLPDPLTTPELPADTMTPEEREKALPVVHEEIVDKSSNQNFSSDSTAINLSLHEEAQDDES